MPSTIQAIDSTRSHSIKPAQGLRYGNFEGVRNLPPIRKSDSYSDQNLWSMNNEQIYRTVCQWMETWRPWQQRTLLCGIANRCSVNQLEILSTTLEPLRHRDYKTVSLGRYPSAPFKEDKKGSVTKPKKEKPVSRSLTLSRDKKKSILLADTLDNVADIEHIKSFVSDDASQVNQKPLRKPAVVISSDKAPESKRHSDSHEAQTGGPKEFPLPHEKEGAHTAEPVSEPIDQYASLLSSSIMLSALNDASALTFYDTNQFSTSREGSNLSKSKSFTEEGNEEMQMNEQKELDNCKSPTEYNLILKSKENNVEFLSDFLNGQENRKSSSIEKTDSRSLASERKSRPVTLSSRASSTKFLGGNLEFASQSYRSWLDREPSQSSQFRRSAFASSAATTTDFFDREKLAVLGPMQHPEGADSFQKHVDFSFLPIPLQKYYKNSRWWPAQPPQGKVFQQARKQELASNFKEQLLIIWDWMCEWEDFERIAFTKEVAKMCSADVLDVFLWHIKQRLQDSRDICRLPDKVLLYVFSFLSARDIFQASQVCRRWRYLCAIDNLWILKCLEMGEQEGVSNLPELIQQANKQGMSVDWKLAYCQLNDLMYMLRGSLEQTDESLTDGLPAEEEDSIGTDRIWTGIIRPTAGDFHEKPKSTVDGKRKVDKGKVTIRLNTGVRERLEQRDQRKLSEEGAGRRGSRPLDRDGSDMDSAFSEEDLAPLLEEYNMLKMEEPQVPTAHWSRTPRKSISQRLAPHDTLTEEATPAVSSTGRNVSSKGSSRSTKKEEEKEAALDIRTDLSQSRDILGKMVSRTNLEWETKETYADYMRTTLYAGELIPVKRMRRLQGHVNCISCLYFDNRRLVTCGLDRQIRLWDVRSGRSLHKFLGHKGGIRCVQFDNDIMATGSWDCLILIWDMKQFTNITTLQGHTDSITCLAFNGDLLISGSEDKSVRLWRRPTFYCMLTIRFDAPVSALILIDHLFAVATTDLCFQLLDVYTGTRRKKFEPPLGPLHCLAVHGQLLLGGDAAGRICFWNLETADMEAAVRVHDAAVNKVCYIDGRFFTASSDSTIKEWDLVTMTCLRVLRGHKGPVRDVMVSERRIVSCGDDASTRIWDLVLDTSKETALETK
ncbi:uncharacterized protein LOC101858072 [Aplysia californica]|uniref:Uncharacterized protein LOC101858072 n=1 Tax=Aplysia californica TaxID=6500 RepID=A0ABM0K7E8_APLCA|nr:uncharacterized protein LOC101858072 [Aplysia californica]